MRTASVVLGLLLTAGAQAEIRKAYVSDHLVTSLHSADQGKGRVLRTIPTGAAVKVLRDNPETGFSYVAVEDGGMEGFIATQELMPAPPARLHLAEAQSRADKAQAESKALKGEMDALKAKYGEVADRTEEMATESERLANELTLLREASANTLHLLEERNQLQEKTVVLENEMENLRREKESLHEDNRQNWFLIGAGVASGGVLLGLLLPRLAVRRRRWDSF